MSGLKFDPGTFDWWWWDTGSGMRPEGDEDLEEFVHRMTRIAWELGAKSMRKEGGAE